MIRVDKMSKSGYLIVAIYFEGYSDSYQNDTRRFLRDRVSKEVTKKMGIEIEPTQFSLIKQIGEYSSRALGDQYSYRYKDLEPEKIKLLIKTIREFMGEQIKKFKMWKSYDLLFANWIEEVL